METIWSDLIREEMWSKARAAGKAYIFSPCWEIFDAQDSICDRLRYMLYWQELEINK